MDDLSICSGCLICAKLCVHPKPRLKLSDCSSPTVTTTSSRFPSTISKRSIKNRRSQTAHTKQISSFSRCVSKFCELFNLPRDNKFQKDFKQFFKYTTLSSNCPVCEDCEQRIMLISKVMIQIESLQSQLMKLKKSVEKDLSVPISAENESEQILNNRMKYFINCDVETRLFREKLKEKLQFSLTGPNTVAVDKNDVMDSAAIPEINSSHRNSADPIQFDGAVADVELQFALNEDGLNLFCEDFDLKPDPDNGENLEDNFDGNIDYWGDVQPQPEPEPDRENGSKLDVVTEIEPTYILDHTYTSRDAVAEIEGKTLSMTLTTNTDEIPTIVDGVDSSVKNNGPDKLQVQASDTNSLSDETSESEFEPGSDWHPEESDNECIKKTSSGRHQARNKETKLFENTKKQRKPLKCTFVDPVKGECRVRVLYPDGLDAHINRFHKNIPEAKAFECNICPFATGTMRRLTLHKKRHAGIKDVTCEVCGMSFPAQKHLLGHKRRKHGEPYPIQCKICKKGFNRNLDLKLHNYRNHEDGKEYTHRCSVCNEGFYSNIHLNVHMVKHAERTFKCDECPKAYTAKSALQKHKRTHTGIRPFACDICDWKFYTQQKVDLHRTIHTKKRPFLCQQCGFSCRLKELLTSHLKVHENNKFLAEQGIEKAPRLAKPRNRRMKTFGETASPVLPLPPTTATQILTGTVPEITEEQAEFKIISVKSIL